MKKLLEIFDKLKFLPELSELGLKTYLVGGAVRDGIMHIVPKDFDFIIEGIEYNDLIIILKKYGKCDLIGESFGVLYFKDEFIEAEIAVPRIEIKTGDKHTDFKVEISSKLTILDDLSRRDFTMNAIAIKSTGEVIDPYNGLIDIKKKLIRMVNPKAFQEDPLRMLRGVNFLARFKHFVFEPKTLAEIKRNASNIQHITGERILIELKKIIEKGEVERGVVGLSISKLDQKIFGFEINLSHPAKIIKTIAEFIFSIFKSVNKEHEAEAFFKTVLKGDTDTCKDIAALVLAETEIDFMNAVPESRYLAHKVLKVSSRVQESKLFPASILLSMEEFSLGLMPSGIKKLSVNGDDLLELGLSGLEIGKTLDIILKLTYAKKIKF